MVPTLDFTVAFANRWMYGLTGVAVEVEREGVLRLAGGAGVPGRLPLVGLQVGSFVDRHKKNRLFLKLHFLHFVHRVGQVRLQNWRDLLIELDKKVKQVNQMNDEKKIISFRCNFTRENFGSIMNEMNQVYECLETFSSH